MNPITISTAPPSCKKSRTGCCATSSLDCCGGADASLQRSVPRLGKNFREIFQCLEKPALAFSNAWETVAQATLLWAGAGLSGEV
jgi:hypothetical protein